MTQLADAPTAAGHVSPVTMPQRRPELAVTVEDPQLHFTYWHHCCPDPGCLAWVPNHRRQCVRHEETR